ncbi:MAG: ribbon-helix-helix domain-containing protein [Vicinamibacterales bacterium]
MVRTQVQLTDKQAEALRRRSKRESVSIAELVRQAIDAFTRAEPPSDRELRDRARRAAGRFASGVRDTSSHHDEALAEAFQSR